MKNINITMGMSGCELAEHIKKIGLDNVKLMSNNDDMLAEYDDDELIDQIINNYNRDVRKIITELFQSGIVLDSDRFDTLTSKLNNLLSEVNL